MVRIKKQAQNGILKQAVKDYLLWQRGTGIRTGPAEHHGCVENWGGYSEL